MTTAGDPFHKAMGKLLIFSLYYLNCTAITTSSINTATETTITAAATCTNTTIAVCAPKNFVVHTCRSPLSNNTTRNCTGLDNTRFDGLCFY